MTKQVYIKTFGCQMNDYDSGKMRAQLLKDGYAATDDLDSADLVIVNTCSVREKPEQKLHHFLGRVRPMKRERPLMIAVAGCVAQQEGQAIFDRYKDVDLVLGPDGVPRIQALVREAAARRVLATDFLDADSYPFATDLDPAASGRVAAFVTIQKGCDNRCTFCIVPTTRGVEVSRPSSEIVDEVRRLADAGVQDVTLIGQNVNSYGLKVKGEKTFAELLHDVHGIRGIERIRYTTSHPKDMGLDVVEAYRVLPKLADHLHLPVQSGSDAVLRRMKRFYDRAHYASVTNALREARPSLVLTTDFIIGFPGETDDDFAKTMDLLEAERFHGSFSFKYSPRPGTPALRLKDAVPDATAQRRLEILQARQNAIALEENRALEGTTHSVLVEGPSRHDEGVVCGRTSGFKMVNFAGPEALAGTVVPVTILRGFTNSLRGELSRSPSPSSSGTG